MTRPKAQLQYIPIEQIVPGQYQPRRHFAPDTLAELALSIQAQGLLQPVIVRPLPNQQYELIAGERRWRASQLANLAVIPCLVRAYTDEQAAASSMIENLHRHDLNPIETARAYQRLLVEFHYTQEELSSIIGIGRVAIAHKLRLLHLAHPVQQQLEEQQLSEGHAKVLASVAPPQQIALANDCIKHGWSVRKLEHAIQQRRPKPASAPPKSADVTRLEQRLTEQLGSEVQIEQDSHQGGWLRIRYVNYDILEGLLAKIGVTYD